MSASSAAACATTRMACSPAGTSKPSLRRARASAFHRAGYRVQARGVLQAGYPLRPPQASRVLAVAQTVLVGKGDQAAR
jgi:hypothetical protein